MPTIIIPARINSTRLPGKPLANVRGIKMVQRVYRQCVEAGVGKVFVAIDDECVAKVLPENVCIMTSTSCECGSDRVAEAVEILQLPEDDVVLNVQGDMPFVDSRLIRDFTIFTMQRDRAMTTVAVPTLMETDPSFVYVTMNYRKQALYFSRFPIPHTPTPTGFFHYRHVGMYGFKVKALQQFHSIGVSPLERAERLEQLRVIENDLFPIDVMTTKLDSGVEINTPEDLRKVNE